MNFAVTVSRAGGVSVVSVAGDVDMRTAPRLSEAVAMQIDDAALAVVIDLSAVSFLDSSGLVAIVTGYGRACDAAVPLSLVCSDPTVLKLLRITALDTVLDIHADLAAALAVAPVQR